MFPRPTTESFHQHLSRLGLRLEAIVIGGSALGLLGVVDRPTRDFDVLASSLPTEISDAARVSRESNAFLGSRSLMSG